MCSAQAAVKLLCHDTSAGVLAEVITCFKTAFVEKQAEVAAQQFKEHKGVLAAVKLLQGSEVAMEIVVETLRILDGVIRLEKSICGCGDILSILLARKVQLVIDMLG